MTLDRNHPYLPSHTRGTHADSGQVDSPDNGHVRLEPVPTATVHYSWHFVSPQLLNSKGEQIFYPVVNDADRTWTRSGRLIATDRPDLAEADLNGLQAEFESFLRRSREAVDRRNERQRSALHHVPVQQIRKSNLRTSTFASIGGHGLIRLNK